MPVGDEHQGGERQGRPRSWRPEFAIAHNLKIGYLLFFKKLTAREYRVVVFDYSCCEVVGRCPEHPRSMRRLRADEE
jgi:hypothetical protein